MTLYTNTRVGEIDIKLILDNYAATAQIITANGNTKTPIEEIDNFLFKINGIQISTKVLIMEATQYQALVGNDWLSKVNAILDWNTQELQLTFNGQHARVPAMCGHFKNQHTEESLIEFEDTSMPPTIKTYQVSWADNYRTKLLPPPTWEEKGKGRAKKELQLSSLGYVTSDQKNLFYQPPRLICVDCLVYWKDLDDQNNKASETTRRASHVAKSCQIKDSGMMCLAEEKHAIRLELAPTREKQKQRLANLNTKLCNHCLIPCHFQYCDECDLMFNPPLRILFPITELPEPKEEVLITKDMSFQNPTEDTETEQYLTYPDLSKELELKYTMVQVAFRFSLAKKKIDIKRGIIDAGYTGNIIVMLQNNSDRPYKIESQEKIAQAIFLPLVKIPQLTLLGLTARGINGFGSSGKGNVPVNFMEENSDQIEFIHTNTVISILPYRQYILKIQDQALLFEASPEICSLANVANLYLPAKAHKHFKIPIHNPTEDVIEISKGTLISSISADSQNSKKPQSIPDFAQLFLFCDITSQVWNLPKESYLFTPEEINKLNLGNLILLNQYANVFASKNEFGCTDIVKHQIDTGDAQPIKQ
ncbi:hypothetical protein G9A89_013587 [Geosiphon pyriformis]|nr:hypothetical protein G9A89_013587 [Geosiphon pyriformis]